MSDIADTIQDAVDKGADHDRLNTWVAILVALSATFMALCNVKDGNVVQAMQQAQTHAVDQWSYYQAKSTKQHIAENAAEMLAVQRDLSPGAKAMLDAKIADYEAKAKKYEGEKEQIRREAERLQKEYDRLNEHDDQFDMAEAALSVAIALFGVTALTRKRWLLFLGLAFSVFGLLMGLSGFLGWSLHPDWLARILS